MPKNSRGEEIPEQHSDEWKRTIESQRRWNPRAMRSLFGNPNGKLVPDPLATEA